MGLGPVDAGAVRRRSRRRSRSSASSTSARYLELTIEMMRQFGLAGRASARTGGEFHIEPEPASGRRRHRAAARHRLGGVRARGVRPASVQGDLPQPGPDPRSSGGVGARRSCRASACRCGSRDDGLSISIEHDGTPPVAGRLDCRDIPDMVPILSTLASRARGRTVLSHVAHVQLKESDRVASMLQLRKMGARRRVRRQRHGVRGRLRSCTAPSCRRSTTTGC